MGFFHFARINKYVGNRVILDVGASKKPGQELT